MLIVKDEDGNIVELENNEPPAPVAPKKKKKKKSVSKKKDKNKAAGPSFIGGRGTSPDIPEPEDAQEEDE